MKTKLNYDVCEISPVAIFFPSRLVSYINDFCEFIELYTWGHILYVCV